MLKKFLMKKMMKAQMKGVPEAQQEKILKAVDENPELFEKIALEIQQKVKSGVDQKTAALEVMTANQDALRRAMGK